MRNLEVNLSKEFVEGHPDLVGLQQQIGFAAVYAYSLDACDTVRIFEDKTCGQWSVVAVYLDKLKNNVFTVGHVYAGSTECCSRCGHIPIRQTQRDLWYECPCGAKRYNPWSRHS